MAKASKPKPVTDDLEQVETENRDLNRTYEEWKVRRVNGEFEKDSQKPIRTTRITPERAEILNSQSANTLVRLYEI